MWFLICVCCEAAAVRSAECATVATSKTLGMEIPRLALRAIRMALRIFISGV